jgi:hypothetical protein
MRRAWRGAAVLAAILACGTATASAARLPAGSPQGDYLTHTEADKIRDAESPNERIKLFLDFAADRLQRFNRELHMKDTGPRRADFLNSLMDAFDSCVNEASSRIDNAVSNGNDVRDGIKDMEQRGADFMTALEKIKKENLDLSQYRDALEDAMGDLRDDIKDAKKEEHRLNFNAPRRHHRREGRD